MSKFALAGLAARQIQPQGSSRMPKAVTAQDFDACSLCIALCDREHRPMMQRLFPSRIEKVIFWQVEDLAFEPPDQALAEIEKLVRALVEELAAKSR